MYTRNEWIVCDDNIVLTRLTLKAITIRGLINRQN